MSGEMERVLAMSVEMERILVGVVKERKRQNEKWGVQRHFPLRWLCILLEETGEIAEAMNDSIERGDPLETAEGRIYHEVMQVAAVAVAWLESIHRAREERP